MRAITLVCADATIANITSRRLTSAPMPQPKQTRDPGFILESRYGDMENFGTGLSRSVLGRQWRCRKETERARAAVFRCQVEALTKLHAIETTGMNIVTRRSREAKSTDRWAVESSASPGAPDGAEQNLPQARSPLYALTVGFWHVNRFRHWFVSRLHPGYYRSFSIPFTLFLPSF